MSQHSGQGLDFLSRLWVGLRWVGGWGRGQDSGPQVEARGDVCVCVGGGGALLFLRVSSK